MRKDQLIDCHQRIKDNIHRTPVLTSRLINEISGSKVFFKSEHLQRMGAFKMRGAVNAVLSLSPEQREKGVVTHSSGNFAQAVSLAALQAGIKAFIVMPENAPEVKKAAVRNYGGQITECSSTIKAREEAAQDIACTEGATLLHPSNQVEVILGQGTAAMELLDEIPDLDCIVVPVGGGGLIAGTALACAHFSEKCIVIGAEPSRVDDAYRSLKSGKIETNTSTDTIADGLRTQLGDVNFPIIQKFIDEIILVEEDEIVHAMRLVWERMKQIIEPSSAVAVAAVLKSRNLFEDKKTGLIISGGNVDLGNLPFDCTRPGCTTSFYKL